MWARRTWGQTLLELLSLLGVVEGERVEVAGAPDLELGLGLAPRDPRRNLLYARSWIFRSTGGRQKDGVYEISGCGDEGSWRRTLGILPPRDVDELLDVANLLGLRHMNDIRRMLAAFKTSKALLTILALVLSLSVPLSTLASPLPLGG